VCVAILVVFVLAAAAHAQQVSQKPHGTASDKPKTSAKRHASTQQPPKTTPQPPQGSSSPNSQPPAEGTTPQSTQGGTAQGEPAGTQQGAQDPTQLPAGMTNEPQCPCPLTTQDPAESHFQMVCGRCHLPDRIVGIRKSGNEWKETIDKMILKGAPVSDEDYDVILAFLVRNFDRVDINWVESGELTVALGLTQEEADAIVKYRTEHGDFKDFDALTKVPGVDVKKLEAKRVAIVFQ
jgi:competence protein ComEA